MEFLGLGTSSLFAIGLSFLVLLTFLAGLVKVALNKRDLRKKVELANLEAANKQTDREKLVGQREPDEGDLFGVRAIQAGFYGGVSQSCLNSPTSSRSSSVCSIGFQANDLILPAPSALHLEPPKPTHKKLPSGQGSEPSSQNSTSPPRDTASPIKKGAGHPPPLRINIDLTKSVTKVPTTPEPVLKTASGPCASPDDLSESFRERVSPRSGTPNCKSPSSPLNKISTANKPNFGAPENNGREQETDYFATGSATLKDLPRQISPPAIMRDSVVSKLQVSIHPPNGKTHEATPEGKGRNSADTSSIYSARTSVIDLISGQTVQIDSSTPRKNPPTSSQKGDSRENFPVLSSSTSSRNTRDLVTSKGNINSPNLQTTTSKSLNHKTDAPQIPTINCSDYDKSSPDSSQNSLSTLAKDVAPNSSELTPLALKNLELQLDGDSPNRRYNPRSSQASIDDFYDTYYRQSILRQSGMHYGKKMDFDRKVIGRIRT